jgi:hypothetical protein
VHIWIGNHNSDLSLKFQIEMKQDIEKRYKEKEKRKVICATWAESTLPAHQFAILAQRASALRYWRRHVGPRGSLFARPATYACVPLLHGSIMSTLSPPLWPLLGVPNSRASRITTAWIPCPPPSAYISSPVTTPHPSTSRPPNATTPPKKAVRNRRSSDPSPRWNHSFANIVTELGG